MNSAENEQLVCRHVLQRLADGGQPPHHGIMRINVGNESYLDVLASEYLDDLLHRGSAFKLVQGHFGAGKTHFLLCVRELAWQRGFACALVELSPEECPYDDSRATYAATARAISVPGRDVMDEPISGLGNVLREAMARRRRELIDDAGTDEEDDWSDPSPQDIARANLGLSDWLDDLDRAPCESLSYRLAVVGFLRAVLQQDTARERVLEAWLAAEAVPAAQVRDDGVFDSISHKNGFLMLRSMTQMLAAAGFGGTALLFDEVDRNLSFSSKRTQIIGDNLRQVVDLCGRHKLPRTLFVYAVPPEFMRSVVPDYPALYQRLKSPARLGVRNARSVVIDLDDLDLPPSKLLAAIAEKIFDVFDTVHPGALSADCQRRNGRLLAAACVSTQFDVNHRRLFVKTFIDFLQHQRETGEIELTDDAAIDIVLDEFEGLHA